MNLSKILEASKSNKGLKSRIFKEHIESNDKRIATSIEKWKTDTNRQYIEAEMFQQLVFVCLLTARGYVEYIEEKT